MLHVQTLSLLQLPITSSSFLVVPAMLGSLYPLQSHPDLPPAQYWPPAWIISSSTVLLCHIPKSGSIGPETLTCSAPPVLPGELQPLTRKTLVSTIQPSTILFAINHLKLLLPQSPCSASLGPKLSHYKKQQNEIKISCHLYVAYS